MARIDDGFSTIFTFSLDPSVEFWEKTVQYPGLDSGGPNDTSTMRNTRFRTMAPKKLITLTAMSVTAAYDPHALISLLAMLGVNQLITATAPDTSTYAFWGWLDKFVPNENQEGSQPTAAVTIQPSNQNDSGVETEPVYTAPV